MLSDSHQKHRLVAVKLSFAPTQEKEIIFNIVCKIKHRVAPLMLNVKVEGYTMNCKLFCKDSAGNKVQLSSRGVNEINFGNVQLQELALRQLYLLNSSALYSLEYSWQWGQEGGAAARQGLLHMDTLRGQVQSGETEKCLLTYCPAQCAPLKDCRLTLKVTAGPTFTISVVGQGVRPGLHLSFLCHQFGHTFVQYAGEPPPSATLTLTNKDTTDISVCCLYASTPQLHHNFEARVLGVGKSLSVAFTFRPPEAIAYHEQVVFEVNGTSQRTVEFYGSGCDVKVEVADRGHKLVSLGSCFVGDFVRMEIPIVNRSPAPITFHLLFSPSSADLKAVGLLSVIPTGRLTLPAKGGTIKVEVLFKPKARIPSFTEQVLMEFGGVSRALFALCGACLGMDIVLETNYVPFGTVFLRGQTSRKLVMTNHGDINTRFRWDSNSFLPDFSISPVDGYIAPGMELAFDLNFHPKKNSADIRYENLRCFLDGGPHTPLLLTMTGSCTDMTPMKDVYTFSAVVRCRETKSIPITNRTMTPWLLSPIIEGSQWSGAPSFLVEHEQTRMYDISYRPLTMTLENKHNTKMYDISYRLLTMTHENKHNGTVFFPFPDGLGQLYNLVGTAEAPRSSGKVTQEVPCKTSCTQVLPVQNWLSKPQRFQVKIDVVKSEKVDSGLKITNMDFIDIPASGKKNYKFNIYAYREGVLNLKVTFTHEPSGEYQFHEVNLRFTRPGAMSVLRLCSAVRHTLQHRILLDNPLQGPATLTATCSLPEITMPPSLVLPPQSKGYFTLDYMPLKVGEIHGKLELTNPDLGLFVYDLNLQATPASPEKVVHLRVTLGQSQVHAVRFLCITKHKTEYTCKVDSADFQVDKGVTVTPPTTGSCIEATVDVTFEPSRLGEQTTALTISSPVGGDYVVPLVALCTPPTPQGPIPVKLGGTAAISFRNVFLSTVTFQLQVDNPHFQLQKDTETIRAKKDQRIIVQLNGSKDFKGRISGRLVVSCQSPTDETSTIQWVYYLKGINFAKPEDSYHHRHSFSLEAGEKR
ncbi:hypothetical protein ACOMHN_058730 [Nucella lapillus]